MTTFIFTQLQQADLQIDAVYEGGRQGNAGDDPLGPLLRVSNSGGFRYRGNMDRFSLIALTTGMADPDWPDRIDRETGIFTYYGDNKVAGQALHSTPRRGNEILRRLFEDAHGGVEGRRKVPPIFVFATTRTWRDVEFLGLVVPGTSEVGIGSLLDQALHVHHLVVIADSPVRVGGATSILVGKPDDRLREVTHPISSFASGLRK